MCTYMAFRFGVSHQSLGSRCSADNKREHPTTVSLQPQTFRIHDTMPEPTVSTYSPSDDSSTGALSKDESIGPSIAQLSVTYESGASREVPTISPPDKPDDTSTIGFNGRAASAPRSILPEGEQYSLLREADPLSVIDSFVFSDERKRVEFEPVESIETTAPVENRVPIEASGLKTDGLPTSQTLDCLVNNCRRHCRDEFQLDCGCRSCLISNNSVTKFGNVGN